MSEYNLLWDHPLGDTLTTPCRHPIRQHPNGDTIPCIHKVLQHPKGDIANGIPVPCRHIVSQHPNGDLVPCIHIVPEHPAGDPVIDPTSGNVVRVPCGHPLPVTRFEPLLHLIFHTNNADVQKIVIDAVNTLINKFQIRSVGNPLRPLHICTRDWVPDYPKDSNNPFFSKYKREIHAIQICPDDYTDRSTILHELGHALAGTQLTRIRKWHVNHEIKKPYDPGLAMGEGWAHFVALALLNAQDEPIPSHENMTDWETRDPNVAKTTDIEYNVACLLWDLYDKNNDMEDASFSFKELFSILSPTLETIDSGLVITGIDDYLDRLRRAFPDKVETINRVRDIHLSSKKLASGLSGGTGGSEFWDDVNNVQGISKITVRSGSLIDAIQIDYITPNGILRGSNHGGTGGSESIRNLAPEEQITKIVGQTSDSSDNSVVKQMTFYFSQKLPDGSQRISTWSVGQPGRLWITLPAVIYGTTTTTITMQVIPGGTILVRGRTIQIPTSTTVGSSINVPGFGSFIVDGENAFHIDCVNMTGFYGRSGLYLDAIGIMYEAND